MFKKYLSDPSFLLLLAGNLFCIWYYQQHPDGFATVVWIYLLQSIIIGLFNFIDLLTISNYDTGSFKINDEPVSEKNKGCVAWFFLVHYGGFHLAYMVFILVKFGIRHIDKIFLLIGIAAFFMESLSGYIKRSRNRTEIKVNIGSMFFLPYLRIIPMHLMILLPSFTGLQPSVIFLGLKMAADILSYFLYHFIYNKK